MCQCHVDEFTVEVRTRALSRPVEVKNSSLHTSITLTGFELPSAVGDEASNASFSFIAGSP